MKISNNKNSSIIETDELTTIYSEKNVYSDMFSINFQFKRYSSSLVWDFKTIEERDKVLEIIKKKLSVVEINDTDISDNINGSAI